MGFREIIILNFTRQKDGGGLQNALSFLEVLPGLSSVEHYCVVAIAGSRVALKAKSLGYRCYLVKDNLLSLITFEYNFKKIFNRGQVCFTFMGPPWVASKGYLLNICGVAYSNLYYPEVDFWSHYTGLARLKRRVRDAARLLALSYADYWIFETDVLRMRAVRLANYPPNRVGVVKMTASSLVSQEKVNLELFDAYNKQIPDGYRFLFLAGPAPNKRVVLAAAIAAALEKLTTRLFCIVVTMPDESQYYKEIVGKFRMLGVENLLYNLGPCPPENVATLINVCDAMCLFSVLESFSNNFSESWRMKKPLVVSDWDWSRSACLDGALYIEPTNPIDSAKQLMRLMDDSEFTNEITFKGECSLSCYPTVSEKCLQYLNQIDIARNLGPLGLKDRKNLSKFNVVRPC